ncbi:MAG: oxidoreductase [Rickettsiales bacterium]|nr:oxidoreductase [Rickettsiales bacterium]
MNSKVALVTGASKGIGAAIALLLAKNKYKVIINYSKSDIDAKKVLKACNKFSESILIKADVTADKDCKKIGKLIKKKFGYINVLINNAGKTKFVEFNDFNGLNAQDFIDIYKCNVISIFQMVRVCKEYLLKTKEPKIINISSVAALGLGSSIAYACSKGAVNSLSLSLARTLAPKISVNTICPGYVSTSWHGNSKNVQKKSRINENFVPLKKSATAEDIAHRIMWFVDSKNLITGETIYVDGGYHLKA